MLLADVFAISKLLFFIWEGKELFESVIEETAVSDIIQKCNVQVQARIDIHTLYKLVKLL